MIADIILKTVLLINTSKDLFLLLTKSVIWCILQQGTDLDASVGADANVHPHVVLVGKRGLAANCFVVAEHLIVEMPSLLTGIDACLKLMYVANIAYDSKVEHLWQFLQKIVYNIFDSTTTFASVYDLQDFLKRSSKKSK